MADTTAKGRSTTKAPGASTARSTTSTKDTTKDAPPAGTGTPTDVDPVTGAASLDHDENAGKPGNTNPRPGQGGDAADNGVADELRSLRARQFDEANRTQQLDHGDRPTTMSDDVAAAQSAISPYSPGAPDTMTPVYAPGRSASSIGDIVYPEESGYIGVLPEGCRTPTTKRLWSAGQAVRRDYFEYYKEWAVSDPSKATVHDAEKMRQRALDRARKAIEDAEAAANDFDGDGDADGADKDGKSAKSEKADATA